MSPKRIIKAFQFFEILFFFIITVAINAEDQVLEKPEHTIKLDCWFCKGTGQNGMCRTCNGLGILLPYSEYARPCPMCQGTGKTPFCDHCMGTGKSTLPPPGPTHICRACNDFGRCKDCKGLKLTPCKACDSKGTSVEGKMCPACMGRGGVNCYLCKGTGICIYCDAHERRQR